ncbi:MAG: hypothetical protein JKY89_00280 [Immundisolibacteraceae bacterium]|nr:hypothetical protein [Immundisolibacteraceae bacterium]
MGILDLVKDGVKLAQASDNIPFIKYMDELRDKANEFREKTNDMRDIIFDLKEKSREKDEEIKQLKERLNPKKTLIKEGDFYYETDDQGKAIGDKYCSHCYQDEGICYFLSIVHHYKVDCKRCSNTFEVPRPEVQVKAIPTSHFWGDDR